MAELSLLNAFIMNLNVNLKDTSVEGKLKRAVQELNKLVHSGLSAEKTEPQRLPFSSDHTYEDVRKILTDKILNNNDLLGLSPLAFTMNVGVMPAASPGVLSSSLQHQAPAQSTPVQTQPVKESTEASHEQAKTPVTSPAMRNWHEEDSNGEGDDEEIGARDIHDQPPAAEEEEEEVEEHESQEEAGHT